MLRIRQLLAFLFVLLGGLCILTWASWYNYSLDLLGLAKHARSFPMGPAKGTLAVGETALGALADELEDAMNAIDEAEGERSF